MTTRPGEIGSAPVIHVARVGSTNEDLLARARRGEKGPLWLRADQQTEGRGRQGRAWVSPVGNLYVSLLTIVTAEPRHLPQLSHVAIVALVQAIRSVTGGISRLRIKWPNDLLVDDAKVAGILVEATSTPDRYQACVIGWGVNCAESPMGLAYPATHLSAAAGRTIAAPALMAALAVAMDQAVAAWENGRGFETIRQRWLADALPLETNLTVRTGQQPVTGRFQGIDKNGRLLLLSPSGPVTLEAGDVFLNERSAAHAG